MNKIAAIIGELQFASGIVIVELFAGTDRFCSMVLGDQTDFNYKKGDKVDMLFKETELELTDDKGRRLEGSNKFKATIKNVEIGEALSLITIVYGSTELTALLPSKRIKEKKATIGKQVIGLIRTHEIVLSHK